MTDKKPRLTVRKRMTLQRIAIATATNAADITRAERELRRLEGLPKGKPRGKSFQKKVVEAAENVALQREVPSPHQQAVEQIHLVAESRKAAEEAREARKLAGLEEMLAAIKALDEEEPIRTRFVLLDDDGDVLHPGMQRAVLDTAGWTHTAAEPIEDGSPAAPRDVNGLQPYPEPQLDPTRDEFGNRTFSAATDPFPRSRR
jgi:hypothetical protein